MKFYLPFIFLAVLAIGINNNGLTQSPFQLILRDTSGGPSDPQILVIKEVNSLKQFYRTVNKTRRPGLAVPIVDFDKEFIVILCMGTMQTTGHEVFINRLEKSKEALTIFVKENHPLNTQDMPKVLNEPFSVYKVKGRYRNVLFKKEVP